MPRDTATNDFLIYLKNAVDINAWFRFGLTDDDQEGVWMWDDNVPLGDFSAWGPGEPSGSGTENCAEYFPESWSQQSAWNDGPCTDAGRKFICQVSPSGDSQKIIFPGPRGIDDYARMETTLPADLTSFTLCVHMRSNMDSSNEISLVSYAVSQHKNELLLFVNGGFKLILQSEIQMADPPVWDGEWHTICTTWRSSDGAWQLYADGVLTDSGSGFKVGGRVRTGGTWILGQEQDEVGGGFEADQSFIGELSEVNLWDRVLSPAEIAADCGYHGNVIDWGTTNTRVFGDASKAGYQCGTPVILPLEASVLALHSWNYLGVSYDYTTGVAMIWHEGIPVAKSNFGRLALSAQGDLIVGNLNTSSAFGGRVSCLQVYGTALSKAEVEKARETCYGGNVAVGKTANQSSSFVMPNRDTSAGQAVDGYLGTTVDPGNACTLTAQDTEPWWVVNLGNATSVGTVRILNRGDCCGERLQNFQVRVGDSQNFQLNQACGAIYTGTPSSGERIELHCREGTVGQYVSVQTIKTTEHLSLCEVEVFPETAE
ncbi:PREDICTED: uncharacterized protein LOC109471278 [Branchiostoma belcheri]|uniref:Uncharacterized protein LOC109471278 n=1 Tax=Branchiostoma belcheri TaxID=7741 RepID=A0A6P4YAN3_BRABE|nr:PREDICTED: uncharacterized protein LOC109471278 [Branchiostoma belcheri]